MTRKQRLETVLKGEEVDRPPVCFYELNGLDQKAEDPDPYNVFSHPSWAPILKMARDESDRIALRPMRFKNTGKNIRSSTECKTVTEENGNRHQYYSLDCNGRKFTWHDVRELDINTIWHVEYPLKTAEDLIAWLDIQEGNEAPLIPDISQIVQTENEMGDSGIVAVDIASPLCEAASYFSMEDYLVIAMQEPELFHRALKQISKRRIKEVEAFAQAAPGRLWRVFGPEYACAPFLPPKLYEEYSVKYDAPIADIIRHSGGYPRIHCHGNLKNVLGLIRKTGWTAIDPVEPPPQGDVSLKEAREILGPDFTIFGNIEVSHLEILDEDEFTKCVRTALKEGPIKGKQFVLMPSSSPYGRFISPKVVNNYRIMIDECNKAGN